MLSNCSHRKLLVWILTALAIVVSARESSAMPVTEYRQNVEKAMTALDTLNTQDETETFEEVQARNTQTLNSIRTLLPLKLQVEWNGTSYLADNTWLHQGLQKYSEKDDPIVLMQIQEQMKALQERLVELEKAKSGTPTRADEKQRMKEILARSEFRPTPESPSVWNKWMIKFLRWLSKLFGRSKPIEPSSANLISQIAQYVVLLLAIGVIAYALRMFLPTLRRDRHVKKSKQPEARIVLGERLDPEKSASDILSEAEALARKGDVRAAIRKAYIALLVELGERKVISLAQYKTNRDYVSSVRDHRLLYGKLVNLTDRFERHWYGFAAARETDWTEFRAAYSEALRD